MVKCIGAWMVSCKVVFSLVIFCLLLVLFFLCFCLFLCRLTVTVFCVGLLFQRCISVI